MTGDASSHGDMLILLKEEIRLSALQLERSRRARGVTSRKTPNQTPTSHRTHYNAQDRQASPQAVEPLDLVPIPNFQSNISVSPSPAAPEAIRRKMASVLPTTQADVATRKEGSLLHLTKSGAFGFESFQKHFFVIDETIGVCWYESQDAYLRSPNRPLGQVPFWQETKNSRGSRFKKAAVCWPLILPEDCKYATDPSMHYFAIDYVRPDGSTSKVILATASESERDGWIRFITKYINLYLAPRAESEEFQHYLAHSPVPVHRSGVIDGEAPGGNVI